MWIYFTLLVLLFGFAGFLWKSGELLVHSDPPTHTRWAVTLSGEGPGMVRTAAALQLFQEGRFDSLILSGEHVFEGHYSSEFSSEWLLPRGFPKDRIFQLRHEARSTLVEERTIIRQARLLGIDTLLLITSDFHTARAGRIFRKLAGGFPVVLVYAAGDPEFDPKAWWAYRESRSIWIIEWLKTVNSWLESWNQKPLPQTGGSILLDPNPTAVQGNVDASPSVISPGE